MSHLSVIRILFSQTAWWLIVFLAIIPISSSEINAAALATDSLQNHVLDPARLANGEKDRESLFPSSSRSLAFSNFTWGVDLGTSIDMDGNDMSTFDIDAVLGYKNSFLRIAGFGVGLHRNFGNANTFIPIYAIIRTSFRNVPSRFFFNLKAGYSFNTIADSPTFGDVGTSVGVGINLAMSQRFQSHIIISYGYRHYSPRHRDSAGLKVKNSNLAQIGFGVNF